MIIILNQKPEAALKKGFLKGITKPLYSEDSAIKSANVSATGNNVEDICLHVR